jgi:putative transposase
VPKENAGGRGIAERVKRAAVNPRYWYRRVAALLKRKGIRANLKLVNRIWRLKGLKVPPQQVRRRRRDEEGIRYRAILANHVWSYVFVFDQTTNGRKLKLLTLVDEYTRECLEIEVGPTFKAKAVVEVLRLAMAERGIPDLIRSDNSPEFIARAVQNGSGNWVRRGCSRPVVRA